MAIWAVASWHATRYRSANIPRGARELVREWVSWTGVEAWTEVTYVRSELEVRNTSLDILVMGVVEMTVNDLLGEGEWSV